MSRPVYSPTSRSASETTSPAAPSSPAPTSPVHIDNTALKATNAGVKKPAQRKKQTKRQVALRAKLNMQKMHAFFKAHRDEDEYKDMTFQELQKALGKLWKVSPENPKNSSA